MTYVSTRLRNLAVTAWTIVSVAALLVASAAGADPDPPGEEIRPFTIHVDDATLRDLKQRLERTRIPQEIPGAGWDYGVPASYVHELVAHWREHYDWRTWENRLNTSPQYKTTIDGIEVHFIDVRSKNPQAMPLVLVHGWPGSFVEFYKIIGPLTEPERQGGKAEDSFHVIVPSLPGFGFSSPPTERGWSSQRMARHKSAARSRGEDGRVVVGTLSLSAWKCCGGANDG